MVLHPRFNFFNFLLLPFIVNFSPFFTENKFYLFHVFICLHIYTLDYITILLYYSCHIFCCILLISIYYLMLLFYNSFHYVSFNLYHFPLLDSVSYTSQPITITFLTLSFHVFSTWTPENLINLNYLIPFCAYNSPTSI